MSASSINIIIYDLFISLAEVDLSAGSGWDLKSMATLPPLEANTDTSKYPNFSEILVSDKPNLKFLTFSIFHDHDL